MKKIIKTTVFGILISMLPILATAQTSTSSFNGFHIGLIGEGSVIEKMTFQSQYGSLPNPLSHNAIGWKTGLEFSYHFAKYFGFSVGIDYGTTARFNYQEYMPYASYFDDDENKYGGLYSKFGVCGWQVPIKFEVHVPFHNEHWALYSAIGVNIRNIPEAIGYSIKKDHYLADYMAKLYAHSMIIKSYIEDDVVYKSHLQDKTGHLLRADLTLNLGIYYRLPYNDLIRAGFTANFAFNDSFTGFYSYPLANSGGSISYRHNYIGMQIAYIHCFKTKAQKKSK